MLNINFNFSKLEFKNFNLCYPMTMSYYNFKLSTEIVSCFSPAQSLKKVIRSVFLYYSTLKIHWRHLISVSGIETFLICFNQRKLSIARKMPSLTYLVIYTPTLSSPPRSLSIPSFDVISAIWQFDPTVRKHCRVYQT